MQFTFGSKGWLFCILGLIVGSFLVRGGWIGACEELELRSRGNIVVADVLDARVIHINFDTHYEIRYSFSVNGGMERFDRNDRILIGRTDLWSSVPDEVWQRARKQRTIEVVYLVENPAANRPKAAEEPLNGNIAVAVFGMVLFISCGAALLISLVRSALALRCAEKCDERGNRGNSDFKSLQKDPKCGNGSLFIWLFGRNDVTPLGTGNQIKLIGAALGGAVLGTLLTIEFCQSLSAADAELTHGQVIHAELTTHWHMPRWLVTIRIDGTATKIKAILLEGAKEDPPERVSFYYSGDPSQVIYLPEDVNRLYLGLFFFGFAAFCLCVCFWDRICGRSGAALITLPNSEIR